ncbi:hypothetical protein FOMPIDRAFT_91126 [Fomitopsis schrenkii]|uniref:DUF6534 domain-containing protein n=1 Tax=Fomitopsis schrenkii TaxID=2126942 RepID=S8DSP3_FOMSC|nr:hypothetical protein FOMPIDRAFT_91126 [Fomitopsis schrenkii]
MSPPQTVSNLLGPLALGILLASIVFGINCLQAYLYYTTFSQRDSAALKAYVAALMTTDCVHVVLSVIVYYHYTVDCFGDLQALYSVYWLLLVQVLVGSVLGTMVRQYFVYRIYRPFSLAYSVIGLLSVESFSVADHLFLYSAAALCSDIACDSLIAITLTYCLYARRTVFPRTNHAIHLLVMYALNTCALNTMLALATLVTFIVYPQTTIYTTFWFVLVRVYTCSMLSTLNSRENIRQALESHGLISFPSMEVRRIGPEMTPDVSAANVSKWDSPQDERMSYPSSH